MAGKTPFETVEQLADAFKAGDTQRALALYEPEATFVTEAGTVVHGRDDLRQAIEAFAALRPTLVTDAYKVFETQDIALYCSQWRLTAVAPDGSEIQEQGLSTDILRRAQDGTWRIVVDNPWGTAVLEALKVQ